jgi:hypothetical protein
MGFFSRHIDHLLQMDWQTLAALALLCALAAVFIKDGLPHPPFVVFVYPFLLLFSILAQHFFLEAELFSPKRLDQWLTWTLIASICGSLIGTGLVAAIALARERRRA